MIPLYQMSADAQGELIYETSFVGEPATGKGFLAFKDQKEAQTQKFQSIDALGYQRCVSGVLMMPDTNIIRLSQDGLSYYYVKFTKDALKEAVLKSLKAGKADSFQFEHNGEQVGGCATVETWIINSPDTKSPIYGLSLKDLGYKADEIPMGTVMRTVFVNNSELWAKIMDGTVTGFSIGGVFGLELVDSIAAEFSKAEKMTYNVQKYLLKADSLTYKGKTYNFEQERVMLDSTPYSGKLQFSNVGIYELVVMDGYIVDFYMVDAFEIEDEQPETEMACAKKEDYTPAFQFEAQLAEIKAMFESKFANLETKLAEKEAETAKLAAKNAELEKNNTMLLNKVAEQPIEKKETSFSNSQSQDLPPLKIGAIGGGRVL